MNKNKKNSNKIKILIVILLLLITTGCTTSLTDKNKKAVEDMIKRLTQQEKNERRNQNG